MGVRVCVWVCVCVWACDYDAFTGVCGTWLIHMSVTHSYVSDTVYIPHTHTWTHAYTHTHTYSSCRCISIVFTKGTVFSKKDETFRFYV